MAIINRLSRLFRADFNAVLDQLEEPELIVNQAIRDMEDDLAERERHLRQRLVDQRAVADRVQAVEKALADNAEQIDLCFDSDNDQLARKFIRRKLESQRAREHLVSQGEKNAKTIAEQQAAIEENRTTLEALRQKAEVLATRTADPRSAISGDFASAVHEMVSDDEVEVAFLREKRARSES